MCIFFQTPPPPFFSNYSYPPILRRVGHCRSAFFTPHTLMPFRAVQPFLPTGPYQTTCPPHPAPLAPQQAPSAPPSHSAHPAAHLPTPHGRAGPTLPATPTAPGPAQPTEALVCVPVEQHLPPVKPPWAKSGFNELREAVEMSCVNAVNEHGCTQAQEFKA